MIDQVDQSLRLFNCDDSLLKQIPASLDKFRLWFEEECSKAQSFTNFHDILIPIIDYIRITIQHRDRDKQPWMKDLALLAESALNASEWGAGEKPAISSESIRRYLERKGSSTKVNVMHQL